MRKLDNARLLVLLLIFDFQIILSKVMSLINYKCVMSYLHIFLILFRSTFTSLRPTIGNISRLPLGHLYIYSSTSQNHPNFASFICSPYKTLLPCSKIFIPNLICPHMLKHSSQHPYFHNFNFIF